MVGSAGNFAEEGAWVTPLATARCSRGVVSGDRRAAGSAVVAARGVEDISGSGVQGFRPVQGGQRGGVAVVR